MKLLASILIFNLTACNPAQNLATFEPSTPPSIENPNPPTNTTMVITINNTAFEATIFDNATSQAFKASLPLSLTMHDMNDNEKYATLPSNLPTNPDKVGTINSGDIMLFGSNTIVIFYKTLTTSYSYTRIGSIENLSTQASVMGGGSVNVKFGL